MSDTVTVRFYGPARDWAGAVTTTLPLEMARTVGALAGQIAERYPRLGSAVGVRLAVNRAFVPLNHVLADGDEVAVIPPVSGG